MALSIETRKPSENLQVAELQLGGLGHGAPVPFLARLVKLNLLSATTTDRDADEVAASLDNEAAQAQLLGFLPGIVQADEWQLIATMEGQRTVLWQNLTIGSMATPRGVYRIVRTLQHLGTWAREIMRWPWLRAVVEGIAEAQM